MLDKTKEEKFKIIVDNYSSRIYFHIRRIVIDHEDANKILHKTFINAWKDFDKLNSQQETLNWLLKITIRTYTEFIKTKKRKHTFTVIKYEDLLSDKIETDTYFTGNKIQKELQKAILQLPTKQRIIFNLKYYEDLKSNEISKILNIPIEKIENTYSNTIKKIEKYINQEID